MESNAVDRTHLAFNLQFKSNHYNGAVLIETQSTSTFRTDDMQRRSGAEPIS